MAFPRRTLVFALSFVFAVGAAKSGEPARVPKTSPWNAQKLDVAPPFEWVESTGPVRSLLYEGEPYRGKPTKVFAFYASPATLEDAQPKKKSYPGVVLVHGGGGTAFQEWALLWAKRGYAAIAMDLAGNRPLEGKNPHEQGSKERHPDGGPNQSDKEKFSTIDEPVTEQWSYHAVAAAWRAHSLIRSFPEVDSKRTAVTGISWGGYLTCILAGVDDRFKAAVPVYGCGFLDENSAWLGQFAQMTPQQREKWTKLWDPSRYLPSVSMPIFFINGTNDGAYPLDSYMKSYDVVHAPKQIRITVNMPHSHPDGWAPKEIGLFIDQHILHGDSLPQLDEPRVKEDNVQIRVESKTKLTATALHFTKEITEINKRTWESRPGVVEGSEVTTPVAPADATAWFITVTDERDATVSTPVYFPLAKKEK